MTFTELEYLLMLAVAVLLWRNAKLDQSETDAINAANKYAYFLIQIGKGKGRVQPEDNGFRFQEISNDQKPSDPPVETDHR